MKIIYETERLVIRQWEEKDCKDLFEYAKNEEITKSNNLKYLFLGIP